MNFLKLTVGINCTYVQLLRLAFTVYAVEVIRPAAASSMQRALCPAWLWNWTMIRKQCGEVITEKLRTHFNCSLKGDIQPFLRDDETDQVHTAWPLKLWITTFEVFLVWLDEEFKPYSCSTIRRTLCNDLY